MKTVKFAENLRSALKQAEMYQNDLARLLGTTQQTVSRWLTGKNEPDFETLFKICVILNETPNSLLGFDEH